MAAPEPEPPTDIRVTLSAAGVVAPALRTMRQSAEVIAIAIDAVGKADLTNLPQIPGAFPHVAFAGPTEDDEARKAGFVNWLLSKGFQEVARGLRESLEEAFLYVELFNAIPVLKTWGPFQELVVQLRDQSNKMNFPDLLTAVSAALSEPLIFEVEYRSLQKARNCFEHRGGIVGRADVNHEGRALKLVLPRVKMFVPRNGEEIELHSGFVVESGERIAIRRESRQRIYSLGERIQFNAGEFHEIAFASYMFASDLESKLPKST